LMFHAMVTRAHRHDLVEPERRKLAEFEGPM